MIFVEVGVGLLGGQHLLPGDFHLLGTDVVRLDAGHIRVFKGQNVGDVNGQKPARRDYTEVAGDGLAQQAGPRRKVQLRFVGLADKVRRRPEAQRHRFRGHLPQQLPGVTLVYFV